MNRNRRSSSRDEGELSDDNQHRNRQTSDSDDSSRKVGKDVETKMRVSIMSRLSKKKHSESDCDDDDVRFTIQPKDSQKAKETARIREKEREREKRKEKDRRDDRQKDKDLKGRHDRSNRPNPSRHDEHRHKKHEDRRRERERSYEKEDRHKRKDDKRDDKHKKRVTSSSSPDEDRSKHDDAKKPRISDDKLFDRVLDPKYRTKRDDVMVVEDVEMSPIEILDEKTDPDIVEFTLNSPAGPKKYYSKFDSDPESDIEEIPQERGSKSPDNKDRYSDIEILDDEDDNPNIAKSIDDDEDEEEEQYDENVKWQDLTDDQKDTLSPELRKRLEDAYQKELISKLPVFYPGVMGCRNIAEFECVNRVEEGTFGVVYRGKDKRTDEIVALKRLKMEKEKEGFPITALREVNMLLKAGNHPNIVNVKEILIGTNMDKIYMAMEFVEHDLKSLIDTMVRKNKRFSAGEQKTLLHQLLSGIEHMHKLWILHRDLKTSNLLMSHRGVLKIADFGLAREYGSPLKKFTSIVVTLWYRSPELLLGTHYYSTPVDMWSVGCIMAEFILLKPLFPGRGEIDQLKKIFMELGTPTENIWPSVVECEGWTKLKFEHYKYNQLRKKFLSGRLLNDTGFHLLNGLLTYDPSRRLSAKDALKHEWFQEEPLPTAPEDFPTFPAKSEQNKAPPPSLKAKEPTGMNIVDAATAKLLKEYNVRPDQMKPSEFSLKFDNTRFQ